MARRTRWWTTVFVSLVALVVGGCGSGDAEPAGASASGDFAPVTITHALGVAEITSRPQRVVTLGQGSIETAIALGSTPVGTERYAWGSDDTGYLPWVHEAVSERGGDLPTQFAGGKELELEAIAALRPDVILAPWSGITQEQYDKLSAIAPTVAYEKEPWVITWQQQISVIGRALGKQDQANALIETIKQQLSAAARPEYRGVTFSYIYNSGPGSLGVFFQDEQRVAMVRALGLTVDPVIDELRQYEVRGTDSASIGLENANKLAGSDLIFTFYTDSANRSAIEAQPAYRQIPAIARGSVVAPTDQSFVTGSSLITPLTVPWTLKRFVPMIDEAVSKLGR